jgi:DNA-binding NtrC family response regulator
MDGIRLAHYIRDRYPPTLLVIASGAIRPAVSELPADAFFVPKPFDPYAVLRTIQQAA